MSRRSRSISGTLTDEDRLQYRSPTKKRSTTWSHYSKKIDNDGKEVHGQYLCKHCGVEVNYRKSLNKMEDHLDECVSFQNSFIDRTGAFLDMMIMCGLPYNIVENEYFKKFLSCFNYVPMGLKELENQLRQREEEQDQIIEEVIEECNKIATTGDGWKGRDKVHYQAIGMSVIVNFEKLNFCLAFEEVSGRETGENLSSWYFNVLQRRNIQRTKVITFTSDNASNMVKVGEYLENESDIIYLRCGPHTMQLGIKDSLNDIVGISDIITHFRQFVISLNDSYLLMRTYKESAIELRVDSLVLILDVITRWNSKYQMLVRIEKMKEVLLITYQKHEKDLPVAEEEWLVVEDIIKILKPVAAVNTVLEGESNSYLSDTVIGLRGLMQYFDTAFVRLYGAPKEDCYTIQTALGDNLLDALFDNLKTRFSYCFEVTINRELKYSHPNIYYLAVMLDIRHKDLVKFTPEERVILWNFFFAVIPWGPQPNGHSSDMMSQIFGTSNSANRMEYQRYYANPSNPSANPLLWWKENQKIYPSVYPVAMEVLVPTSNQADCERINNVAGDILTLKRCRMSKRKVSRSVKLKKNFLYLIKVKSTFLILDSVVFSIIQH